MLWYCWYLKKHINYQFYRYNILNFVVIMFPNCCQMLAENKAIAATYTRRLAELREFYDLGLTPVILELNRLESEPLPLAELERRLDDLAPKLKALVRRKPGMADDPLAPQSQADRLRSLKASLAAYRPGEPEPTTTLLDAKLEARAKWTDTYEKAVQIPESPAEMAWFEKRYAASFYGAPTRANRLLMPMETLWFTAEAKQGVLSRVGGGYLRQQLVAIATRALAQTKSENIDQATDSRIAAKLEDMIKSAVWIELQIGSFFKSFAAQPSEAATQTSRSATLPDAGP